MKKESADKTTHRSPRLSREQNTSDTTPSPETARDGRTTRTKRKACPEQETPTKRAKVAAAHKPPEEEEDLRIRVLKRKSRDDGEGAAKTTKKRRRLDPDQDGSLSSSVDTENSSNTRTRRSKRKAADRTGEGLNSKRTRKDDHQEENQEENQDHQEENQDHQEDQEDLTTRSPGAEFEAKYEQQDLLGEGGCGSVFAGFRKADNLPVAIKHIPKENTMGEDPDNDGQQVSVEVAIMLKLRAVTSGSAGTSASVSLLDWYDLGPKLILVMERPVPCVDLFDYVGNKGGSLSEKEATIILKQLVNAARELEDQQIFHRDIKRENILIETGSEVPRVRLIDFGLGCFTKDKSRFQRFCGTPALIPPEWYFDDSYTAGPTTVWQVGVVLFDSLHTEKFETMKFVANKLEINTKLSKDCQDFLQTCLSLNPNQRPTLEQLQSHPWLR